ncbi:pectin lyase fold/virulence factor [Xylariaceae sp. FL1272]|nr:pectin lyase fold/virulence factor [Xylariaceae sp. FL1272]
MAQGKLFLALIAQIVLLVSYTTASLPLKTCNVPANGDGSDDGPTIQAVFDECSSDATIAFDNTTYYINSTLNTTTLSNVNIDLPGYLLWSDDTEYWLNHSMPVGYQNQSTVWFFGGENVNINGYGTGTLDGNGQAWYDLVKGESNYPKRPMGFTIWKATNASFTGLNFVQSQMWTMAIMHSESVLMEDIYVNSTSQNGNPARNTDGADTLFSNNVIMRRWHVDNGDDAISLKANSTNVIVEDCVFETGQGFALGSIGQYPGEFETIENVTVRNITGSGTKYAAYVKTWTGDQVDYPPNGGGGGLGFIRNITISDFVLKGVRDAAVNIGQCTTFSGTTGDCNSSLFHVGDILFSNFSGTTASSYVGKMQCSPAAGGCTGIEYEGMDLTGSSTGTAVSDYQCSNVVDPIGFEC